MTIMGLEFPFSVMDFIACQEQGRTLDENMRECISLLIPYINKAADYDAADLAGTMDWFNARIADTDRPAVQNFLRTTLWWICRVYDETHSQEVSA